MKGEIPEVSADIKDFFNLLQTDIEMKALDAKGLIEWAKDADIANESLIKFLNDTDQGTKDLASYQEYLKSTGKQTSAFSNLTQKAGTIVKSFGAALASMAVMWAIGEVIALASKAIDDNIHRLENAKEALSNTETQLSDVKSEIESTTEKIKELQSLESLSIVDEEDLQRLKDQNEELRIRQQYLEKQKQLDQAKVAEYTKQKYNFQGGATTQEEIDDYRSTYGGFAVQARSNDLANLIAQYQYYSEERAKAIDSKDVEAIDKWDSKLKKTTQNLMDNRSTLQGWADDLGNEASPELDGITSDLERIDNLLLSPGQKLVNFIDSDALKNDKEQLVMLTNSGKLTADTLSTKFSDVDEYLKNNGLTLEDLVSVAKTYKDELSSTGDIAEKAFTPLTKQDVITNINSLSEGFESLDKIMKSISDKDNPFDYALLDDKKFKDNFDELGEAYTNFIETVSNSPKDINATQSAFNELVTEWIDSKDILNGVTAETSDLSVAMLKNMGVANAEEVVLSQLTSNQEHLAAQKAYTVEMSDALANATANEIPGLIDEATQSDIAKVALAGLALEKAHANGTILNTSGDIENAIALINTIGAATTALVAYNKAKAGDIFDSSTQKANLNNLLSQKTGLGLSVEIDKQLNAYQDKMDSLKADVDKEVQDAIKKSSEYKGQGANVNTIYNGGPKTNKDSGSGKDKKDTSKDIDWIDRQLKLLDEKRSELLNKSNDTYIDYLGITRDQFNRAQELFNSDLEAMPSGFDELGEMARSAGVTIAELYSLIANGFSGESKQSYLEQALEVDKEALSKYADAVQKYQEEYEKSVAKISPQYRAKIENGDLSIDTLSGDESEEVQKAIADYDKLNETKKAQYEKQKQYLDDIVAKYDSISSSIQNENSQLENSNALLEKQIDYHQSAGTVVDSSYYNKLIQNTASQVTNTKALLANKRAELQDLIKEGATSSSEQYVKLNGEISDAEVNIYALKKAQEEYNNKLLQLPIENMSIIVSMYNDIGTAISNWGNEVEASGKKLDAGYYQSLISNGATVIDQLKEQSRIISDVQENYDVGSDQWNKLYQQLISVNSEMSSMVGNLRKWNEELLKMPLENISGFSSELQKVADGLSKVQSEQDSVISAVTGAIKEQIDLLNEQGELETENKQSEIDALKEKLDLLDKENEYRKLQYDLEQKQFELERARNQKTNRVNKNCPLLQ